MRQSFKKRIVQKRAKIFKLVRDVKKELQVKTSIFVPGLTKLSIAHDKIMKMGKKEFQGFNAKADTEGVTYYRKSRNEN